jgi:hypothetical protein
LHVAGAEFLITSKIFIMTLLSQEEPINAEDHSYNKNLSKLIKKLWHSWRFNKEEFSLTLPDLISPEKGLQSFDGRTGVAKRNYIGEIIEELQIEAVQLG